MRLWSFLDERELWHDLLTTTDRVPDDELLDFSWLMGLSDSMTFVQTMGLLVTHSLVQRRHGTATYFMHPVVHRWVRHLSQGENSRHLADLACHLVAGNVPWMTHQQYWIQQERLLPHAIRCFDYYRDTPEIDTRLLKSISELGQ